jgi:Ca2+-binding EF-hand superfamily protein
LCTITATHNLLVDSYTPTTLQFDAADKLQKKILSVEQLEVALSKQNISVSPDEALKLVEKFDASGKGGVDFEGYLKVR